MPLAAMLRRKRPQVTISDDANRVNGPVGVTSVGGIPWQAISGVWTVTGNMLSTTTPAVNNPILAVDIGSNEVDFGADISAVGNDAIYLRIVDANNWTRVKLRSNYVTGTAYCSYTYYAAQSSCSSCGDCCCGACSGGRNCACASSGTVYGCGSCPSAPGCSGFVPTNCGNSCVASGTCSQACGTYAYYDYYLDVEKMVGGTLTTITSVYVGSSVSVTHLRFATSDTTVTMYATIGGTEASRWTGTITDGRTATKHGVGRGGGGSSDGSGLDNFTLTGS